MLQKIDVVAPQIINFLQHSKPLYHVCCIMCLLYRVYGLLILSKKKSPLMRRFFLLKISSSLRSI